MAGSQQGWRLAKSIGVSGVQRIMQVTQFIVSYLY